MPISDQHLLIVSVSQISSSQAFKFTFMLNDKKIEGFLINQEGRFFAYINRCRHMGITLDWDTDDFFTKERDALICKTHGAIYHPETGECSGGPCTGKSLHSLPLVIGSGKIYLDLAKTRVLYAD